MKFIVFSGLPDTGKKFLGRGIGKASLDPGICEGLAGSDFGKN